MPATVYAIAGGKGGVGKTTTAANLAATLRATGREVLLVDADLAMSNLQDVVGLSHEPTLHDVLAGTAGVDDAIVEESADVLDAAGGLDVLPGSTELDDFARADPDGLHDVVDGLAADYDTVVLDTASGVTRETAVPIRVADETVVVTTPDETAVRSAEKTVRFVERVGGSVAGLVVSRTCVGLDEAEIADAVDADHLATVPDLTSPDADPLRPYRTLLVRLLIGSEVAPSDPAAVLDIEGTTPRITETLESAPGDDPATDRTTTDGSGIEVEAPAGRTDASDADPSDSGDDTDTEGRGRIDRLVGAIGGSND